MASPDILDFPKLLAPIAGDHPAGIDFRHDDVTTSADFYQSDFYKAKAARKAASDAERTRGVIDEEKPQPAPDWRPILDLAPQVIAEQSKDLLVAVFLLEALVREHGYAGLRDGFRLIREMLDAYWDTFYPLLDADDGGLIDRLSSLAGLNGEGTEGALIGPIRRIPITNGGDRDFTYEDFQQAVELDGIADAEAREKRVDEGAVSMDVLNRAVRASSLDFLKELLEETEQAQQQWAELGELLTEKCGQDEPPTSNIRNVLDDCHQAVVGLTRDIPGLSPADAEVMQGELVPQAGGDDGIAENGQSGGPMQTREEAFRSLTRVADFFQATEPHSPVSYLLRQAVRWGKMPLPELWQELINEDGVRDNVFRLVGIQPSKQEDDE